MLVKKSTPAYKKILSAHFSLAWGHACEVVFFLRLQIGHLCVRLFISGQVSIGLLYAVTDIQLVHLPPLHGPGIPALRKSAHLTAHRSKLILMPP